MKLATHNSLTYLKPKYWWMKLFKFCYQCQDRTIENQYVDGVRYFDFRFSFDSNRHLEFRHKLIPFKSSFFKLEDILTYLNTRNDKVYIRVVLEKNTKDTDPYDFRVLCELIQQQYENITFLCGEDVKTKKVIYDFKNGYGPQVVEKYSSVTGKLIDGLWPRRWAKKHNQEIYETYKDTDKYLMIDFYETVTTIH